MADRWVKPRTGSLYVTNTYKVPSPLPSPRKSPERKTGGRDNSKDKETDRRSGDRKTGDKRTDDRKTGDRKTGGDKDRRNTDDRRTDRSARSYVDLPSTSTTYLTTGPLIGPLTTSSVVGGQSSQSNYLALPGESVTVIKPQLDNVVKSEVLVSCNPSHNNPSQMVKYPAITPINPIKTKVPLESIENVVNIPQPQKHTVDDELLKRGFQVIERVLCSRKLPDGTNKLGVRYIKATNNKGQTAYVLLDVDGFVAVQPNDLTLIETNGTSTIPYSLKTGTVECAGYEVAGIAFECSEGICTVVRNPETTELKERVLVFNDGNVKDEITISSAPIPYPIVKYSEILSHPDIISKYIDIATRRIWKTNASNCEAEMMLMNATLDRFNLNYKRYLELQKDITIKLKDDINKLNYYYEEFEKNPPTSEEHYEKVKLICLNLQRRYEPIAQQFKACSIVTEWRRKIEDMNDKLAHIMQFSSEIYKIFGKVHME